MDLWVFDNDGTLYDDGLAQAAFTPLFERYISGRLGVSHQDAPELIRSLRDKWKTDSSLLAFQKEYGLPLDEMARESFLRIDLSACGLAPDPLKAAMIRSLPGTRIVFTNNPASYARATLAQSGLGTCFSDIIGMEDLGFYRKPQAEAYKMVAARYPGHDRIFFCDDSAANRAAARSLGWITMGSIEETVKYIA